VPRQRATTTAGKPGGGKRRRSAGRPRPEDVAAIEERLLRAALQEFLAHGYGGASLNRLVKLAGVSKTTLYSRFASKEELFRAIMRRQIERVDLEALLKPHDGRSELGKGLAAYANHMLERSLQGDLLDVNRLIYSESQRFPELGAAAAERTGMGVRRITAFIRDCAEADGLPCRDAGSVAEVFILMIRGWYVDVMLTNRPVSAAQRRQWVERAVHILLAGRADW
jgi:AcrR family transcriptional regulator